MKKIASDSPASEVGPMPGKEAPSVAAAQA
jgi:hypothetical protein